MIVEIKNVNDLCLKLLQIYGFHFHIEFYDS
jgi:hypothetical protein